MRIAIGSDHAGFALKEYLKESLSADTTVELADFGTFSEASVDYPDFAHLVAQAVETGRDEMGILVCGSGIGVSIAANKHHGVRAALCWNPEIASLARKHNNANIICLPARFISSKDALDALRAFLITSFEGGRHQGRVDKIE